VKITLDPAELLILRNLSLGKCQDIDCEGCPIHSYCSPEIATQSIVDLARFLFILGELNNDND